MFQEGILYLRYLRYGIFLQHLTNDNFDMLIADLNTLETIYTLYFTDHIILNCTYTLNSQDIMRITLPSVSSSPASRICPSVILIRDPYGIKVSLGFTCFLICNDNFTFLLSVIDNSNTRNLCDDGKTFRAFLPQIAPRHEEDPV